MKKQKVLPIIGITALLLGLLFAACPTEDTPDNKSVGEPKILILQAYGTGATDNDNQSVSHSFIELYNTTDQEVKLSGYSLWYADGGGKGYREGLDDAAWTALEFTASHKIPAHGSFLVLGQRKNNTTPSLAIPVNSGDLNSSDMVLSNRSFKVCLIHGNTSLADIPNPFNTESGEKAKGYIDMLGATNTDEALDTIQGYEGNPAKKVISKQNAVRRKSLNDTNDNAADFEYIRYSAISSTKRNFYAPHTTSKGSWNPFDVPSDPDPAAKLLILQVGAATDGNVSHSFIELYNNSNQSINLSGYSLQYAAGTKVSASLDKDGDWKKIDLSGSIPPYCSFLVLGKKGTATTPSLAIVDNSGDMNTSDEISNRAFKVVLLKSTTLLTDAVQNPFGTTSLENVYIDMVGAVNDSTDKILGFEARYVENLKKHRGIRRTSLADTDDNRADFEAFNYDGATTENIALKRPRNTANGAWNPITGEQ